MDKLVETRDKKQKIIRKLYKQENGNDLGDI